MSTSGLTEPTPDATRCTEETEAFHALGVFSTKQEDNRTLYDTMAVKYDTLQEMSGFNDPYELAKTAVEKLGQPGQPLAKSDARIMDLGCGTGLMGNELKKAGFTNIYGIDGAPQMLSRANEKGIYQNTWEVLVGCTELPTEAKYDEEVEGSGYDAVFSSACMIKGNFPNTCFDEMLKILRPGGHFIFTIRNIYLNPETDKGMGYAAKLAELEQVSKIVHVETVQYTKYKGLDLGSSYMEEAANVKIYKKAEAVPSRAE